MRDDSGIRLAFLAALAAGAVLVACGSSDSGGNGGGGGAVTGGAGGSTVTGGSGGSNTGGSNTGGSNTGGSNTGGSNTGGSNTGGSNTGGDGGSGGSNTGGSNTGGSNTGGSNTGGDGGSGGTGGSANCTEITATDFAKAVADGTYAVYRTNPTPDLGDTTDTDAIQLELYGSTLGPNLNGEAKGTFDLTQGGDDNYATCSRCIRAIVDPTSSAPKLFFQSAGTLAIADSSDALNGKLQATLTDITLIEVTIDSGTFESTPVAGGECLHLATATIDVTPPVVPATWTCNASYYGDGDCDCGCGAFDELDCTDANVESCAYCDDTGSCSTDTCPGTINPTDNSTCTTP